MAHPESVLSRLDCPVYVVTTVNTAGERAGCLVGFASQCSLNPPRFVVWLSRTNHTYRVACGARFLAVHLLAAEAYGLASLFGGRTGDEVDKFSEVDWVADHAGVPVVTAAPAWFVGEVHHRTDGGDHEAFVLTPIQGPDPPRRTARRGDHLMLSDVMDIAPGHPA